MKKVFFVLMGMMLTPQMIRPASAAIANGDFTAGNSGFTSTYTYAATSTAVGDFGIVSTPITFDAGLWSFGDHTTGSGLMMVVDGYQPNTTVWTETVAVTPQTNYSFTGWFRAAYNGNLAQIEMDVVGNGSSIGSISPVTLTDAAWEQLAVNFNSGAASSVTLTFVDQNSSYLQNGDDFAVDDLAIAPVPAPEPGSLALVALGAVLLRKRRSRA